MHAGQTIDEMLPEGPADQELLAWLGFADPSCKGFGHARIAQLKEYFGSLQQAWVADRSEILKVPGLSNSLVSDFIEYRRKAKPERWFEICRNQGITITPSIHSDYPNRLRHIFDPPGALFWKGAPPSEFDLHIALAIVGTRTPTIYGQKHSKEFAYRIAGFGIPIVSGMAVGIDTFAHRAALEAGGKTIAVLGNGVDICYPSSNRPLYETLINGTQGAVVSEYFPGSNPEEWMFPKRNRIISGICAGTLVIEAGINSGALITAKLALNEGRDVFALPGRVDSRMSDGTNELLKRDGAHWVKDPDDILRELGLAHSSNKEKPAVIELYGREKEVYDLLSHDPVRFDALIERTRMTSGELSATLTMLELGGTIIRVPGDAYVRA
jgi:DNA processing protein